MLPRRLAFSLLVLAVCLFGGWRHAEAGPGLFAGATLPVGGFGDLWKAGFHAGAEYAYPVTPMAGVGLWGAYHRLPTEIAGLGHANMVEVLAIGKLTPPAGFFLMGGLGFTHLKTTFDVSPLPAGVGTESATAFTAAGGVGFSVAVLRVTALYHNMSKSGSSKSFVTVSAGVGF